MARPDPNTGVSIKDTVVPDPKGLLLSPHVEYALRPDVALNARLGQSSEIMDRAIAGNATVGDVDAIRRALGDVRNGLLRPMPGSASARNVEQAKDFGDWANKVEGLGASAHPGYADAMKQYRADTAYNASFTHGLSGMPIDQVSADDPQLGKQLKTPAGLAGYEHGQTLAIGKQILGKIAPNTVQPQSSFGPAQGAHLAAGAAITPSPYAVFHFLRAIPGFHLPEKAQQIIAQQLFNPSTTRQGIANMARAGLTAQQIRQAGALSGAAVSARVSHLLSTQGQP